jgi:hypothetical protein
MDDNKSNDLARWPAIESDPDTFTHMLQSLGMPKDWQFAEVLGMFFIKPLAHAATSIDKARSCTAR